MGGCEKDHNLAVSATLCFQNAAAKACFRILNVAIHNHSSRRTNAEPDLIQGGIASDLRLFDSPLENVRCGYRCPSQSILPPQRRPLPSDQRRRLIGILKGLRNAGTDSVVRISPK